MLRKLTSAAAVAAIFFSFALTQAPGAFASQKLPMGQHPPMFGKIVNFQQNQISFHPFNPTTKTFGPVQTFQVTAEQQLQIFQIQNGKLLPVTGGLKSNMFKNIPKNGLFTSVQLKDNSLSQIHIFEHESDFLQAPGLMAGKHPRKFGKIMKLRENEIVFQEFDLVTKKFGPIQTLSLAAEEQLQVFQVQLEKRVSVPGGLKSNLFQNIPETGLFTTIQLDGNNLSSVDVFLNEAAFLHGTKHPLPPPPGSGK